MLALLGGALLVALGLLVATPMVGRFLLVADPLQKADAIFVLEGATPAREMQAAALYHLGLAPRVILTLARDPMQLARQLAGEPTPQERAARALMHAGVPAPALVRLDREVETSAQELGADYDYARTQGFRRVILVTSPPHTRRVRIIWNSRYQASIPALVYPTAYEAWDAERWWRSRRSIEIALHELVGIGHFFIGSPISTFGSTR